MTLEEMLADLGRSSVRETIQIETCFDEIAAILDDETIRVRRQLLVAIVEEMERIHVDVSAPYEKCAQYRDIKDRLAAASKGEPKP